MRCTGGLPPEQNRLRDSETAKELRRIIPGFVIGQSNQTGDENAGYDLLIILILLLIGALPTWGL